MLVRMQARAEGCEIACPGCGKELKLKDYSRTHVHSVEGVHVIYDVRCPLCGTVIGRMSWGELIPSKELQAMILERQDVSLGAQGALASENAEAAEMLEYICPHCGKTLVEDAIRVKRKERDRRIQDRRRGDRRQLRMRWMGDDRRKDERRQDERRSGHERRDDLDIVMEAEAAGSVSGQERRGAERRKAKKFVLYDRRKSSDRREKKPKDIGWDG